MIFLLFATQIGTSYARTIDCYEESPNLKKMGQNYFDLDKNIRIDRSDEKKIKAIQKSLKGKWRGTIVEISCTGPDRSPRRKIEYGTVKASFSNKGIPLIIAHLQKKFLNTNISRGEKVTPLLKDQIFSLTTTISSINSTTKFRQKINANTYRTLEWIFNLHVNNDMLYFNVDQYSNGVFEFNQSLNLAK